MKIVLSAINARFSHSNPAVYSLKNNLTAEVAVIEFNINQPFDYILGEIYQEHPDVLGISCYIWNRGIALRLANEYKKLHPGCTIILGGPEASSTSDQILPENPGVDFIVSGEGELLLAKLVASLDNPTAWSGLPGLTWRTEDNQVKSNVEVPEVNRPPLDQLAFPYTLQDLQEINQKIVYYESSRGCPYRCSYCLSSDTHRVRALPVPRVKKELQQLVASGVSLIKFVDRTFNYDCQRAQEIWEYLISSTPNSTHFHFEIGANLLNQESLDLLAGAPPGKFQFEIGVQSTNPMVLEAVHRPNRTAEIAKNVGALAKAGNIHLHLDLIAGLPLEDWSSIARSFDQVFLMGPHRIQLGFLKVLPGTPIAALGDRWGLQHLSDPPYEVIQTSSLSFLELWNLKRIEELVETYYNTGRFMNSLNHLVSTYFDHSAFSFFSALSAEWVHQGLYHARHKPSFYFGFLYRFLKDRGLADAEVMELIKLDFSLAEQHQELPMWIGQAGESDNLRQVQHHLARNQEFLEEYLPHLAGEQGRQIIKKTRLIKIKRAGEENLLLVDYSQPNLVTGLPRVIPVPESYLGGSNDED